MRRVLVIAALLIATGGTARAQQPTPPPDRPDHPVALHFNNGVVLVSLAAAEKEYARLLTIAPEHRTEMQRLRFAALTVALGTIPRTDTEVPSGDDVRARLDWEIRRGVRRPVQRLSRD